MPRGQYNRKPAPPPTDPKAVDAVQKQNDAVAVEALASHPAARQPRQDAVRTERRTRRGASLDGMQNRQLDLPPHLQDDPHHVYYWANDEGPRIHQLTVNGEYDVVPDQGGENAQHNSTRRPVGTTKTGAPLYAQLLRKPRQFHEEDQADKMKAIADRENGLLRSPKTDPEDKRSDDVSYVAKGNSIRRGPYVP